MLRGLATINFYADDVAEAARWYADLLGVEPYYSVPGPDGAPAYIEFRLGDYQHELGFIDRRFAPPGASDPAGGALATWRRHRGRLRPADRARRHRVRAGHQAHRDLRDGVGRRPVRQRAGDHVQPALPRGPGQDRPVLTRRYPARRTIERRPVAIQDS